MTPETVVIDREPDDALRALDEALRAASAKSDALKAVCAKWPTFLEGWAYLGEAAYEQGDTVSSYAFCRVGYHRGLDRIRAAGWRGSQQVPWEHEENRGFLRALYGLMRASAAIGEGVEARRCREFLLQLDASDNFGVESIRPAALGRRLEP